MKYREISLSIGIFLSFSIACLTARLLQQSPLVINGWVGHTQQVYRELQALLIAELDGETGQRGYVITDNVEYLKRYVESRQRVDERIASLARITRDNPAQQRKVGKLQNIIDNKFVELERTLKAKREGGQDAAIAVVNEHLDMSEKDRKIVLEMMTEEDHLLERRNDSAYILLYSIVACLSCIMIRDVMHLYFLVHNER